MTARLIIGAYVAVWFLYGWRLTIHLLDTEVRRLLEAYSHRREQGAAEVAKQERGVYLAVGFFLALLWPLVAPARGAYRLIAAGDAFTTPVEREHAQRAELEQLRKLAREHNLPMPGRIGGPS